MGSGKSLLGKRLAEKLGWNFIDLDEMLEKGEQMTISEIFSKRGESVFRELEAKYLRSTQEAANTIIATGGGTPCFFDNLTWMKETGITIYLQASPSTLLERLKDGIAHRPLLNGKTDEELVEYIEDLLFKREPYYNQANYSCNANLDLQSLVNRLSDYFIRFAI